MEQNEFERDFFLRQWGVPEVPSWQIGNAFLYAVEAYQDYLLHGDPYSGGSMLQSVYWKLAIACLSEAKRRSDEEKREEEQRSPQERGARASGITPDADY